MIMQYVSFSGYVKEALKKAEFKKDHDLNCVVAFIDILPGCITQGNNYEEAGKNLIDAIELWLTVALKDGDDIPLFSDKFIRLA
jgi:predicted RNase H-like HicB family nuclease